MACPLGVHINQVPLYSTCSELNAKDIIASGKITENNFTKTNFVLS